MKKKTTLSCFVLFILGMSTSIAQETISGAGGEASGLGGSVSYTVGQVAYVSKSDASYNISEGVQQPYEISETIGLSEPGIALDLQAFPNPTKDVLTLVSDKQNLSYQLMDSKGSLLQEGNLIESNTQINMNNYEPAVYFLYVAEGKNSVKTFKIVKN